MSKRQKNLEINTLNSGAIVASEARRSSAAVILDFFGVWHLAFGIFLRRRSSVGHLRSAAPICG
jgi:hypothetical protein